jgi:hypothetical protein
VSSALVDIDDTAADETAVLAVDTAELALGLVSTSGADGRWRTGLGAAAMGDRMFCAFRARSA